MSATIDEAVVVLCVRIRKPGVTRKVSTADVRVRASRHFRAFSLDTFPACDIVGA